MYMLNDEADKKLSSITLFLTKQELKQLVGYATQLLEDEPPSDHYHLSSEDYQKEITLCIYNPAKIENFNPRFQKLIMLDE